MTNVARKIRDLQQAHYDNFVRCCEGSRKLEAIAVAFRGAGKLSHERLLTSICEYRHHKANTSSQAPLFNYWQWGGLSRQQEDSLAIDLHQDEVLMLISFLATEAFLLDKEDK